MNNLFYFGDEQLGHSNTIPSIVHEKHIAHPSSPINYMGNCQAVVFLICECIPSPPSEDAPLDITVVDCGNEIVHARSPSFFLPLSTISPSANDKQLLTENNMKITQKVLCLGVMV